MEISVKSLTKFVIVTIGAVNFVLFCAAVFSLLIIIFSNVEVGTGSAMDYFDQSTWSYIFCWACTAYSGFWLKKNHQEFISRGRKPKGNHFRSEC